MSVTQAPPRTEAPDPQPKDTLRARTVRGSCWTALSFGGSQLLRFGANLILARLLFPEAFATMVIVNVFIMGLHLFSDVGVIPSIVQNKKGDDPSFLNTAWTIQVVRGFVLWLAACALAYPVAVFYELPELAVFIPVAAFTAVFDGFCSTKLYVLQRHVELGKVAALEFATQVAATLVMIGWALVHPSIWALVGGTLAAEAFRTAASHRLPGTRNRLHWNPALGRELFHFGKWIFVSTMLTFLADQSDRLMFGKIFPHATLGVYHFALMLALVVPQAIQSLGESVFFPSFSRMLESATDFRPGLRSARAVLSVIGGYVVAGMIAAGPPVMAILYDARYADSGWMLQLLAITAWFVVLECSTSAALLAMGQVRLRAASNLVKVIGLITLIPLGFALWSIPGALIGLALAQALKYAVSTAGARRCDLPVLGADLRLSLWVAASGLGALAATRWASGTDIGTVWTAAVAIATVTVLWLPLGWQLWRSRPR